MEIAIGGAHGKIARRLARLLADRGDRVTGLIRNPDHADDVRAAGAEPVLCDLEHARADEIAAAIGASEAVVFAAGAGAGSGAARKWTIDRDGAIRLLEASGRARYLIISSVGAENPPGGDDVFSVYLRAKAEADAAVMSSDRAWTIVRPGRLSDDPGRGRVRIDTDPFRGSIPRDDVATVLIALLHDVDAAGRILYVNGGSQPVDEALAAALGSA